jgi:tetrahydromethanopterin S-methyltransferase subunit G
MELMERDTTEKRLDDLNHKVDRGFERIDTDVRALRGEMKAGFDSVNERFDALNASVNERFEAMHRLMIQVGGGLIGTLIVAFAGLIATQP